MGPTPAWGCFHAGRQARRDKAQGGRAQGGRPGDRPRDALRGHCQAVGEDAHPRSRCLWAERLRPVLLRRRPDRAHGPGVRENPLSTETCVPNLGIGVSFQDTLRPFLEREPDAYDYLEVVPDTLWTDRGPGAMPRYLEDQDALAFVRTVRSVKPVIPHSIGLSIGSAHRFDQEHVDQIASWWSWLRFPWHSDHLAFSSAEGATGAGEVSVGLMLPVAYTEE